ncbi:MAG: hypothetical protein R3B99_22625 [Polyangiales bacterium]
MPLLPRERPLRASCGAKELVFRVEPTEALRSPRTREVAGALAGAIAQTLWSVALPKARATTSRARSWIATEKSTYASTFARSRWCGVPKEGTAAWCSKLLELRGVEAEDGEVASSSSSRRWGSRSG